MDLLRKYLLSGVAFAPDTGGDAGAGGGEQPSGGNDGGNAGGAGGQEGPTEFVTLAGDDDESDGDVELADDEDGETGEAGEGEGEGQQPTDGAQKRKSGSAKWRERALRAQRELDEIRQGQTQRAPAAADDDKDLVEPKEADFPGDYLAYERAQRQYETRKAIRDENRRVEQRNADDVKAREARQRVGAYNDRVARVRDRIPDFDKVIQSGAVDATTGQPRQIRDDVVDLVMESDKGPLLAYHLAKNPDKVAALNRMSPRDAAREIGRLEARIRGPQTKKVTNAPAPKAPLRGGGGKSEKDLAEQSVEDYFAARNAEEGIK